MCRLGSRTSIAANGGNFNDRVLRTARAYAEDFFDLVKLCLNRRVAVSSKDNDAMDVFLEWLFPIRREVGAFTRPFVKEILPSVSALASKESTVVQFGIVDAQLHEYKFINQP